MLYEISVHHIYFKDQHNKWDLFTHTRIALYLSLVWMFWGEEALKNAQRKLIEINF